MSQIAKVGSRGRREVNELATVTTRYVTTGTITLHSRIRSASGSGGGAFDRRGSLWAGTRATETDIGPPSRCLRSLAEASGCGQVRQIRIVRIPGADGRTGPRYHHGVKPRILVVEDEVSIAEPLAESLEREGFAPEVAPTLQSARDAYERQAPDLILLDVMLPDGDGRDLARDIRKESDVPIIMLTARSEEIDRVLGLELGADDYVVKPFSVRELTARIRAIMRRGKLSERRGAIDVGEVHLDPASRSVTKAGQAIEMAAREFDLLHMLMANAGRVVRREDIMDEVWDPHWFGSTKTLDVHISWLRKKIEDDPSNPRYISTIRGVGFRFAAAGELTDPG